MSKKPRWVRLRPHHLMCVHGFQGHGYSPAFVANFWRVMDDLSDDQATIELVPGTQDTICGPCPNNKGAECAEDAKISKLDDAYAEVLGVAAGQTLTWAAAKALVAARVSDEDFDRCCAPCGWRKLGVCKSALQKLRAGSSKGHIAVVATLGLALATILTPTARAQSGAPAATSAASGAVNVSFGTSAPVASPAAPSAALTVPDSAATTTFTTEAPSDSMPLGYATVEAIEQNMLLDKSRRIPSLNKIQVALGARDWNRAREAAKGLETRTDFADYYHYLLGEAEHGRMRKFMLTGALATALVAADQAVFHLSQVLTADPFTTLWRRADLLLGQTQLAMGEIHLRLKHRAKSQEYLEAGFQRLLQVNLLAMVPKATIISYALICERNRTDICASWVYKLAPFVARSEESRVLDRVAAFKHPFIDRTPSQPYRVDLDLQTFQKGFQTYLLGKYEDAYGIWRSLLTDYPHTNIKLRTKFWMGRAAQRSAHLVQAETLYREIIQELPFSYYALMASWCGGIDLSRMMDANLPIATTVNPTLTPAEITHIRRAEILIASAVPELAQIELQDVHASTTMPNEFLVYLVLLNNLAGNHQAAFSILSELSSRSFAGLFSIYGQKLYFPTARMPIIHEAAKAWRVDPLLVLSIIKQESAFNDEALSGANAFGLMQLIGPTARELEHSIELSDLFNPAVNVRLGSRYIRQMLTRFRGNVILALAAYNAGPGNAERWYREGTLLPPEEQIEVISFRESRDYVENILRNYYWYSRRIKGESLPNLMALTQEISPWKSSQGMSAPRNVSSRH